jgi:molybdenum cofactor synthesis domain-containing protein
MERLRKIGFAKLTRLEDALEKLFSKVEILGSDEIETSKSLNRILTENITSKMDVPPFDRSAMDGYAIIAEDSFGASPKNPNTVKKTGTIEIGEISELKINIGEAIRISTGAATPEGCNAVIKIEDTEIEGDIITLYTSLVPGKNVSKKGEDVTSGTEVLSAGTEIKSEQIALLTSLGFKTVNVNTKPQVSVFAVGDELLEVGETLQKNKIYNSNSPMISNLVKNYGGNVIKETTLRDDKVEIKNHLLKAVDDSDIVVFTGGTSVGTKDLLPEIMHENGVILTHGIAMRPGAPVLIGQVKDKIVFCLPGTPVAAYVCFLSIVGLTLRKMMGCNQLDPRSQIIAFINKDVPVSGLGALNLLRVKLERKENEFIAIPIRLKGSGIISSLTESDGIIEIPPSQEGLKKGDKVIVKLFL